MRYSERNARWPTVTGRARVKMIAEFATWYEGRDESRAEISDAWKTLLRSTIRGTSRDRQRYKLVPK